MLPAMSTTLLDRAKVIAEHSPDYFARFAKITRILADVQSTAAERWVRLVKALKDVDAAIVDNLLSILEDQLPQ